MLNTSLKHILYSATFSVVTLIGSCVFAADTITIDTHGKALSIIVPEGHGVSEKTQEHLDELGQGIYTNLHISYAGPLHGKDAVVYKEMIAELEEIIDADIHLLDPALRDDDPHWTLDSNVTEAAAALFDDHAIVICPVGDASIFGRHKDQHTIRVTALEIFSFLTGIPQTNSSLNNFENLVGGQPQGGRLVNPIEIGEERFYVFVRTESASSEYSCRLSMHSQQDLLDLWQIVLGTTIDPVGSQSSYTTVPFHHMLLLERLTSLEECDDEFLAM